jgi:hypothetical protein
MSELFISHRLQLLSLVELIEQGQANDQILTGQG